MRDPYFRITKCNAVQPYEFYLRDLDHGPLLHCENYATKEAAQEGIGWVRRNAPHDRAYERTSTTYGFYKFNLRSPDQKLIGSSELYTSKHFRDEAIERGKECAPIARVDDLT